MPLPESLDPSDLQILAARREETRRGSGEQGGTFEQAKYRPLGVGLAGYRLRASSLRNGASGRESVAPPPLPRLLAPVLAGLDRALENMRRDAALLQRLAELHAQESARRIARDAGIEALDHIAHHGGVFVEQFGQDSEICIVDDGVDPPADGGELRFDHFLDRLDVVAAVQRKALEIDEEDVLQRIVGETLLERDADVGQ